jgi:transcriptional regulator with XRE-family HTH domain
MSKRKAAYPDLEAYLYACKKRGIRQFQVAAMLGVSDSYLSVLRQGKRRPSLAMAKKLSDHCGVPIESFLV